MRSRPSLRTLLPLLITALGGCATSPWEGRITSTMAPSAEAQTTSRADVLRSLASDPPLPGESLDGWDGLREITQDGATGTTADSRSLDLEAALRIALDNDRELRGRLADLGIARGRVRQAGLAPNPEVEVELLPERESRLELAVEYDLSSLILAPLRAGVARAELQGARVEAAGYVVELGYGVRRAYYELAAAEASLAIAQRTLDAYAASRDAASALHAAGNIHALEAAARTSAYENARIDVATLELVVSDRREALVRRLGLHGREADFTIVQGFAEVPNELDIPDDLERRAVEQSLELSAMRAGLDAVVRRARFERVRGRLPDISVDVHVLHGRPEASGGGSQDAALRFGSGVSVGIPLFDRRQGARAAVEAELDAAIARYDGAAIAIRSSARQAHNRLVSAHARVRHFEDALRQLQQRVLEETLLQYDAMQVDVFRLLAAHRDRQAIELAYVDTLREFFIARAAVEALLAGIRVDEGGSARSMRTADGSDSQGGH